MEKREIGFNHGAPENPDRNWDKLVNGRAFIFKKTRVKDGIFLYNCECHSKTNDTASSTGFHSDRDLTPEQVEQLRQFTDFISGKS